MLDRRVETITNIVNQRIGILTQCCRLSRNSGNVPEKSADKQLDSTNPVTVASNLFPELWKEHAAAYTVLGRSVPEGEQ
jgi:hypothetical protein